MSYDRFQFPGDSSIREQKNSVSSYLDAGTVYGDSESDFDQLLDYRSGKLAGCNPTLIS